MSWLPMVLLLTLLVAVSRVLVGSSGALMIHSMMMPVVVMMMPVVRLRNLLTGRHLSHVRAGAESILAGETAEVVPVVVGPGSWRRQLVVKSHRAGILHRKIVPQPVSIGILTTSKQVIEVQIRHLTMPGVILLDDAGLRVPDSSGGIRIPIGLRECGLDCRLPGLSSGQLLHRPLKMRHVPLYG